MRSHYLPHRKRESQHHVSGCCASRSRLRYPACHTTADRIAARRKSVDAATISAWTNFINLHVAAPASGGQLLHPSGEVVSKPNDGNSWASQPVDPTGCPSGAKRVDANLKVEYSWRRGRKWESLKIAASGEAQSIPEGSHAEFITEHYWEIGRASCRERV